MKLYNSLTRTVEEFKPLNPDVVTMYCCGPTVYLDAHIGNFRTYTTADLVYRTLRFNKFDVKYVMNLTDVGHLTGDNSGDADIGEDRMEASVKREGRSAGEIAQYYTDLFMKDYVKLGLLKPFKFTKATEYIKQQIDLVKTLEEKGYTYETSDGVYFDTSKFVNYGQLSGVKAADVLEGARVEVNPEKKHATDFALWKLSSPYDKRSQEWDSPWGVGFPGWHLECSAMSLNELGTTLDIHVGGEDLRMIHHQNEIAQSEAATGEPFVRYWLHSAFLLVDGGRMSKSAGTSYLMTDLEKRGFDPMALRYLYMTSHYRSQLNFTWEALTAAQNAVKKIYDLARSYKNDSDETPVAEVIEKFNVSIGNDINMPEALAVVWELLKSDISESRKLQTLLALDEVLGLDIKGHLVYETPQHIVDLAKTRQQYRKSGIWDKADQIRKQIVEAGYEIEDIPDGSYKLKRGM